MKKTLLISVMLFTVALSAFADAEKDVREAVRLYREAVIKKDLVSLEKFWTDDYTFVTATGELKTKSDRMAELKSGHTAIESIKHESEARFRIHGTTAIVMSHLTITGKYSGKVTSGEFRSLHVWINEGGTWRLLTNQLTPITK